MVRNSENSKFLVEQRIGMETACGFRVRRYLECLKLLVVLLTNGNKRLMDLLRPQFLTSARGALQDRAEKKGWVRKLDRAKFLDGHARKIRPAPFLNGHVPYGQSLL